MGEDVRQKATYTSEDMEDLYDRALAWGERADGMADFNRIPSRLVSAIGHLAGGLDNDLARGLFQEAFMYDYPVFGGKPLIEAYVEASRDECKPGDWAAAHSAKAEQYLVEETGNRLRLTGYGTGRVCYADAGPLKNIPRSWSETPVLMRVSELPGGATIIAPCIPMHDNAPADFRRFRSQDKYYIAISEAAEVRETVRLRSHGLSRPASSRIQPPSPSRRRR